MQSRGVAGLRRLSACAVRDVARQVVHRRAFDDLAAAIHDEHIDVRPRRRIADRLTLDTARDENALAIGAHLR